MNNLAESKLYNEIFAKKSLFIFISPHLDDAVFSAGGLMSELNEKGKSIWVVNVFTKPTPGPYTISINKFLNSCGYSSAVDLFNDRIKEDALVLKKIRAKVTNLNFIDALWRRKNTAYPIPEMNFLYPVFKLTIGRGLVSRHDKILISDIKTKLKKIIVTDSETAILCPVGIGKHTDHLIVRDIVTNLFEDVVYWEDYPYSNNAQADNRFVDNRGFKTEIIKIDNFKKDELVNGYKSQIKAIFNRETANTKNTEIYYYAYR